MKVWPIVLAGKVECIHDTAQTKLRIIEFDLAMTHVSNNPRITQHLAQTNIQFLLLILIYSIDWQCDNSIYKSLYVSLVSSFTSVRQVSDSESYNHSLEYTAAEPQFSLIKEISLLTPTDILYVYGL